MPKTKTAPDVEDATDEVVEISYNGATFVVPKQRDDWATPVELALYQAQVTDMSLHWVRWIELALGDEQWTRLLAILPKRRDLLEFVKLFTQTVFTECE